MLPSKGYFSGMPCPFYDSGICERPHCHFRHSKKDRTNPSEEDGSKSDKDSNVNIIKELVTETVKHVLSHTDIRDKTETSGLNTEAIVTDVVKTFQPGIESKIDGNTKEYNNTVEVPSYKPTPISELNKKHIPVVYAPTRPVYLDRFKKREIKESVLYTPKSLSENSSPTSTYIPSSSSSKTRCEAYSPENVSSYRFFTSQISDDNITVTNDEIHISTEENSGLNIKKNYGLEVSNLKTLEALDKLIEDEFDIKPVPDSLDKDNVKLKKEVELKSSISPDIIDNPCKVLPPKVIESEDSSQKNKTHPVSKHSHSKNKGHSSDNSSKHISSHEKHSHSKSKSHSGDISKSHTNKDKTSKLSISDEKNSPKSHSSDHSSKRTSSHDKHSHSKSKTHSNESSSKHSSSHEKHSKSKNHSNDSSSKSHSKEKNKIKSTSKKCVKDKDKSIHIKEKSKSNAKDNKTIVKLTSIESKLHKKKEKVKEDLKKSHKKRETLLDKEKLLKDIPARKVSIDAHEINKSDAFIEQNSVSSSSDLEEIQCPQEPILIDSSSSSSPIIEHFEDCSMSPKLNLDSDSDSATNIRPSSSASEYDSPPPAKKLKGDEDDLKVTPAVFTSSLFSDRWKKARETVKKSSAAGKIKIAHVPNVKSLLNAKDKLIAKAKSPTKDDLTNSKKIEDKKDINAGKRLRKAHMPSKERIKYPSLIMEENIKVPVSIRQPCLNNLYDEYLKYCEEEEAKVKAQTDEIEICRRVHVPKTYQNAVALSLLKIRKLQGKSDSEIEMMSSNILFSYSIPEFTYGWTIYKCFAEYLMKEEEFISHGFPIEIKSKSGIGYIEKSARRYDVKQPDDPNLRICANCSNNYYVDDKGFPVKEYDCFYHWGRLARTRVRGGITEFYRCCNGEIGSEACTNGRYHVCNSYDEDCLEGFITSRPSDKEPEKAGIYAMDCEMCYTTKGLDLTRCTIVDVNGKMVYDEVIVPEHPILDYNTRFSGITEDMVLKSRKKLRHVQRDLMKLINEKSILVGHSLENDFKALRLFHRTVVDTSIVFPHHMGLPYKRALKLIAKDILKINIQENESGHDSYEDANTCMQIMMARIKEDAKKRKPRVIISLDSKSKTKSNTAR